MQGVPERLQEAARQAGFDNWDIAIYWTADLTRSQAVKVLKVPGKTIYTARVRLGVQPSERPFDPDDPNDRHGLFGYRRLCRCLRCRSAHAALSAQYRKRSIDRKSGPARHGVGGYTGHNCRCEVCVQAWREYKRSYALRPDPAVQVHDAAGYGAGCRCVQCREAVGRPFAPRASDQAPAVTPWRVPPVMIDLPQTKQHGTPYGYRRGCRCDGCRTAEAARVRQIRKGRADGEQDRRSA